MTTTLSFLLGILIDLYCMALLLRVWMQWVHCDFYNPFSQFIVKITQPIIAPLRRFIPAIGALDTASLLLAYLLFTLKFPLMPLLQSGNLFFSPYDFLYGFLLLLKHTGTLIFWLMIIRAILSWISQGQNPLDHVLYQLTEPLMAPIRRILPALGGIDFSAMVVIFILYLLDNILFNFIGPIWLALQ